MIFVNDQVSRFDGFDNVGVSAHGGAMTNYGLTTQDSRVWIDGHVIFQGRMSLEAFDDSPALVLGEALCSKRDALVDLDVISDPGSLADDNTCSMIDEETLADGGAGVNVRTGNAVSMFAHHPWHQRHAEFKQFVGDPIDHHRKEARVAVDNLVGALGGGVSVECRLGVERQGLADGRNTRQELLCDVSGFNVAGLGVFAGLALAVGAHAIGYLAGQFRPGMHQQVAHVIADVLCRQFLVTEEPRKQELANVVKRIDDARSRGQERFADSLRTVERRIAGQDVVGQLFEISVQ